MWVVARRPPGIRSRFDSLHSVDLGNAGAARGVRAALAFTEGRVYESHREIAAPARVLPVFLGAASDHAACADCAKSFLFGTGWRGVPGAIGSFGQQDRSEPQVGTARRSQIHGCTQR